MKKFLMFSIALCFAINIASAGFFDTNKVDHDLQLFQHKIKDISPKVLKLALQAYHAAEEKGINQKNVLMVIDYSKPSTDKRMWVLDMSTHDVLYDEWVAHGSGSGGNYATHFSNQPGSHASSIGTFVTEGTYTGAHGPSLQIKGLEKGINDKAKSRAIVIHGANYVYPIEEANKGRLGRSWGCPAVRPEITKSLIETLKHGSILFAYYPDKSWLKRSSFLKT